MKAHLEIDEQLYESARDILQTRGLEATVRRAFEVVVAQHARRLAVQQLREMAGLELDNPDVMADAWR